MALSHVSVQAVSSSKLKKKYYFGSLIVQTKEQLEGLSFIKMVFFTLGYGGEDCILKLPEKLKNVEESTTGMHIYIMSIGSTLL